jgi:hypothetical protein
MKFEDFKDMKSGVVVRYTRHNGRDVVDDLPPIGTVMTRKVDWLDDGRCNRFEYEVDGVKDYHFFYHDEVEVIDEQA